MPKPMTQGERLIRIETLLESMAAKLEAIEAHQVKQDEAAEADQKELQALKNKGAGILIGVGLFGSAVGGSAAYLFQGLLK